MPKNREHSQAVLRAYCRLESLAHQSSIYDGITDFSVFQHLTCSHTWEDAQKFWQNPGLFVSLEAVQQSPRPKITIIYEMACGTLLSLDLPKLNGYRYPADLFRIAYEHVRDTELGILVHFMHWIKIGETTEFSHKNRDGTEYLVKK